MAAQLITDIRQGRVATNVTILREGTVPDISIIPADPTSFNQVPLRGVPTVGFSELLLVAPPVADVDYFVANVTSGTTALALTLLQTRFPAETVNMKNGLVTAYPLKCATITANGSIATVGVVMVCKRYGQTFTTAMTLTGLSGGAGTILIPFAFTELVSITITTSTSRTVSVGTGNTYGFTFPVYCPGAQYGYINAAGTAAKPGTALTLNTDFFVTIGVPTNVATGKTADPYGTFTLGATNLPGATNAPDGTANFLVRAICDDPIGYDPTGSGEFIYQF